jgi:protein-tyrosine phosphatase
MDRQNQSDLIRAGAPGDRVRLLRSFDPGLPTAGGVDLDVPDPYTGPDEGFDEVFAMSMSACAGLLEHLLAARTNPE